MFDASKARRQKMDARMRMWRAGIQRRWARVRHAEAGAKLSWNRQERRLRRQVAGLRN